MSIRFSKFNFLGVALVLLVVVTGAAQRESQEKLLPNFHQVNEHLYRGAQPLPGGIKRLAALGIKTIVNLRGEDEKTRYEGEEARAAGLRYLSVPMSGLKRPTDEQVEEVLAIINQPENWPVFVHCNHGADRTGTIIAVYRISQDGWSAREAKKEAKRYGFSWIQFRMKDYIEDYERKYKLNSQGKSAKVASSLARVLSTPQTQKLTYDF